MKVTFSENTWGIDLTLEPETVEETTELLRYAFNAKKAKGYISFSFGETAQLDITLPKVSESRQRNYIDK